MTVLSYLKTDFIKHLITLLMAFQIAGCSTEENFNGTSSTGGVIGITPHNSLSWIAPSERDDGSAISLSEIAGYRIYYGITQGNYPNQIDINDGATDQAILNNLPSGTYYVVVTTVDSDGRESTFSDEVVRTI